MDVSPNVLRKETVATLKEIEELIERVDHDSYLVRSNLLLAKSQCVHTLVLLNEKR